MNSNEIYKNYLDAMSKRTDLENKIEKFVEDWKTGKIAMNSNNIQQAIEKAYERLDILKKEEQRLHNEYINQEQSENNKAASNISIKQHLGVHPDNLNIIGGVLSSNASESHLIAEPKSAEQLEQEKQQLLDSVKVKVQKGELSLSQASKLVNDINNSYDFYVSEEKSNGMKK